jgi:Secretion system C-terminal sorting domain/SprB repeat
MLKKTILSLSILLANLTIFAQINLIKDLAPGDEDGVDIEIPMASLGNRAYFSGNDATKFYNYLFFTDGVTTTKVTSSNDIYNPRLFTVNGNILYFVAYDNTIDKYSLCSTTASTTALKKLTNGSDILNVAPFGTDGVLMTVEVETSDSLALFLFKQPNTVTYLGTYAIKDEFTYFSNYKNSVIIKEHSTNGNKLEPVITDGTFAGTKFLKDFLSPIIKFETIESACAVKDRIFIEGIVKNASGVSFNRKYITDGTIAGTTELYGVYDFEEAYFINNTYVIATSDDVLYYDAASKTVASFGVNKDYFSTPIIHNNKVYFHDKDNFVHVADVANKTAKKISKTSSGNFNSDQVLFAKGDSLFFDIEGEEWKVINLKTEVEYSFTVITTNWVFSAPIISTAGNNVVFARTTAQEGSELWTIKPPVVVSPLTVTMKQTKPISCFKGSDGEVEAIVTGGTPPFKYKWFPLNPDESKSSFLTKGTYSVTVVDSKNITASSSIAITEPTEITYDLAFTQAWGGQKNGSASVVNIKGGTPPYTYTWNTTPVQTTAKAINLAAGNYSGKVLDANFCSSLFFVSVPSAPVSANDFYETNKIIAYPNPANTVININFGSITFEKINISLIDITGRVVLGKTTTNPQNAIDISTITEGIYTIQCDIDGKKANSTIVIQR